MSLRLIHTLCFAVLVNPVQHLVVVESSFHYLKPRHAPLTVFRTPEGTTTDEHQVIQQTRAVDEMLSAYCSGTALAFADPPFAAAACSAQQTHNRV